MQVTIIVRYFTHEERGTQTSKREREKGKGVIEILRNICSITTTTTGEEDEMVAIE